MKVRSLLLMLTMTAGVVAGQTKAPFFPAGTYHGARILAADPAAGPYDEPEPNTWVSWAK